MTMSRCQWCGELREEFPRRCQTCGYEGRDDDGIGSGPFGLLLVGLVALDVETGFEGRWLKEYDPTRKGVDRSGRPMLAHIVSTDDPAEALRFRGPSAARRVWMRWDGKFQASGRPSRPLTAFTIEVSRLP